MSRFEFLTVLFSIIIGLGLTHLLSGLGRAYYSRRVNPMDTVHVAWTVTTFFVLILNWWVILLWQEFEGWTFSSYLLMVLWVTSFYGMALALYPARADEQVNYRQLFEENRSWFLSMFVVMCLLDIAVTLVREHPAVDLIHFFYVGHYALLGSVGLFLKKRWFDLGLAYWVVISLILWAIAIRHSLEAL